MSDPPPTSRAKIKRHPERGHYDAATIHAILDEAFVAHVGITTPEGPVVIPMVYARDGDTLLLHGSIKSRLLRARGPICVTVTIIDGLVLAKSLFDHSMNYRSVVIHGEPHAIEEEPEKKRALDVISEHIVPGRTRDARAPNKKELAATAVLALKLDEASAKIRSGPPGDEPGDTDPSVWSGILPLRMQAGPPVPDDRTRVAPPTYLRDYKRSGA